MKHSNRYNWFVFGALSDEEFSFKATSIQTPSNLKHPQLEANPAKIQGFGRKT